MDPQSGTPSPSLPTLKLKLKAPNPLPPSSLSTLADAAIPFAMPTPKLVLKPPRPTSATVHDTPSLGDAPFKSPRNLRRRSESVESVNDDAMDTSDHHPGMDFSNSNQGNGQGAGDTVDVDYDEDDVEEDGDEESSVHIQALPKRRLSQMGVLSESRSTEDLQAIKRKKVAGPRVSSSSSSSTSAVYSDDFHIPPHEVKGVLLKLTTAVRQYMAPDGRNLAALFLSLPSKTMYPDYYVLIKHPIALNIMQAKINGLKYSSVADLKAEMKLMVDNAKTYNAPNSLIYEDAETLWNVFNAEVSKVRNQYKKNAGDAYSPVNSTESPALKIKLKPDTTEDMAFNRDGKRINKKEIDILFRAIEDNNVKGFERAIHQIKIHPDQMHKTKIDGLEFEWAPLHAVSYWGRAKMLDILVSQKANMEIRDSLHGSTPLMWAAYAGKVNTARRLMRNNRPDKFAKNNNGLTAMDLVSDPANPDWRGILNNEPPLITVDKTISTLSEPPGGRGSQRRVSKLPAPEGDSPGQSFQKITYVGDMSLPDASNHPNRSSNPRSQVKDTTPMVKPTMPVDLNKVPKWAKLPNTKDPNQLFLAAGSKEMALLLEAPPIKDIELPLPEENLNILLAPGLKTMRANAVTVDKKVTQLPIRFYLANGNRGVYYSIQVYQNRTPLLPVLLNGGTEDSEEVEPTVVEVTATLWEGVNVFDVIVFLCRKAESKMGAASSGEEDRNGSGAVEDYVGIQKKGHHAFQKAMLIVHKG
ncbi:hypothetical protein HDU78_000089 [Chytriomyces hyalinus]|nr:hypothetical protein HDU78_000089 [Chytriomyces hyalinus]